MVNKSYSEIGKCYLIPSFVHCVSCLSHSKFRFDVGYSLFASLLENGRYT